MRDMLENALVLGHDDPPGDEPEDTPHRWKCCRCKQFCVRVDDAEWPVMQVSKCCGQLAYRVEVGEAVYRQIRRVG